MRIKIVQKPNVKRIDGVRVEPVDQFVPDGVESQPANLIRETYPAYDDDPTALPHTVPGSASDYRAIAIRRVAPVDACQARRDETPDRTRKP